MRSGSLRSSSRVGLVVFLAGCDVGPLTEIYDGGVVDVVRDAGPQVDRDGGPRVDGGPPRDGGGPRDAGPARDGGVRDAGRDPLELPYTSNFDPNLIPPSFGNFDAANGLVCRLITDRATPRFEGLGCESDGVPSVYRTPSGRDVVLVHVDFLDVEGTLEIEGPLPALFVAERFADVDGFIVANASGTTPGPGAEDDDCGPSRDAPVDGSGGGGGGFGGPGAPGGAGDNGAEPGAAGATNGAANVMPLRGGCPGGVGGPAAAGGAGGGAVQISAFERITVDGHIYVNGGGGIGNVDGGGGGGGSGGAVLLEALIVDIGDSGRLLASGGGGGAGGSNDNGADGNSLATPAAGGRGLTEGGRGALGPTPPTAGESGTEAGGGGGGVGRVRINADLCRVDEDAQVLPAPTGC